MANKTVLKARIAFWKEALEKLTKAYIALIDGGVKSYHINDRTLTRLDAPALLEDIKEVEQRVDELTALLEGRSARKAFGVVPRDW